MKQYLPPMWHKLFICNLLSFYNKTKSEKIANKQLRNPLLDTQKAVQFSNWNKTKTKWYKLCVCNLLSFYKKTKSDQIANKQLSYPLRKKKNSTNDLQLQPLEKIHISVTSIWYHAYHQLVSITKKQGSMLSN